MQHYNCFCQTGDNNYKYFIFTKKFPIKNGWCLKIKWYSERSWPLGHRKNKSLCVCIHLKLSAQLQKISSSIIKFLHQRKINYLSITVSLKYRIYILSILRIEYLIILFAKKLKCMFLLIIWLFSFKCNYFKPMFWQLCMDQVKMPDGLYWKRILS